MQTLAKTAVLHTFPKDAFAFIIIDEVHRAGAPSYQRIMNWFRPAFWLGMTGSPERTDGFDIFKLFDHVIAHEIRLSEALEENLLTPFHYFGLSAGTEDKTGEEAGQLPDFTNPNWPERIQHVIDQAEYFGSCGDRVKGLILRAVSKKLAPLRPLSRVQGIRRLRLAVKPLRMSAKQRLSGSRTAWVPIGSNILLRLIFLTREWIFLRSIKF